MCDFADDPEQVEVISRARPDGRESPPAQRVFLRALLVFGIKKEDVRKMFVDNPAKLMWLD